MFGLRKRNPQRVRIEDVDQLSDALAQLDARLTDVEEQEGLRKLSIEDWYEKFRALYARLNKRAQREEAAEPAAPHQPNPAAVRILGGMR